METHILTDVKTREILFIWNGMEFIGSVPGKSQGKFKGSGDLSRVLIAATSFTCPNERVEMSRRCLQEGDHSLGDCSCCEMPSSGMHSLACEVYGEARDWG